MVNSRQQRGTNLFELTITLAVSAILLTLAVPSMAEFYARQQLKSTRMELMSSLQLARGESITNGKHAVLCPSADGQVCDNGTHWEGGWIVFFDLDKDRERSADEPLLWRGSVDGAQQRVTTTRGRIRIRYSPLGTAPGTNLSITLCHLKLPQTSSKLVVSNAGRVRVVKDAGPSTHCSG